MHASREEQERGSARARGRKGQGGTDADLGNGGMTCGGVCNADMVEVSNAVSDAAKLAGVAHIVRLSSARIDLYLSEAAGSLERKGEEAVPTQGPLGEAHVAGETYAKEIGLGRMTARHCVSYTHIQAHMDACKFSRVSIACRADERAANIVQLKFCDIRLGRHQGERGSLSVLASHYARCCFPCKIKCANAHTHTHRSRKDTRTGVLLAARTRGGSKLGDLQRHCCSGRCCSARFLPRWLGT